MVKCIIENAKKDDSQLQHRQQQSLQNDTVKAYGTPDIANSQSIDTTLIYHFKDTETSDKSDCVQNEDDSTVLLEMTADEKTTPKKRKDYEVYYAPHTNTKESLPPPKLCTQRKKQKYLKENVFDFVHNRKRNSSFPLSSLSSSVQWKKQKQQENDEEKKIAKMKARSTGRKNKSLFPTLSGYQKKAERQNQERKRQHHTQEKTSNNNVKRRLSINEPCRNVFDRLYRDAQHRQRKQMHLDFLRVKPVINKKLQ